MFLPILIISMTTVTGREAYYGELARIECEAYRHAVTEILTVETLNWTVRAAHYPQQVLRIIQNGTYAPLPKSSIAQVDEEGTLYMPIVDANVSSLYAHCSVETSNNQTLDPSHVAVEIEECVAGGNPCVYGACSTYKSANGIKRSKCQCRQGFTGRYCDQEIYRSAEMEVLFYSPVIAITVYILFVMIYYFLKKNKSLRLLPKTRKFHFPITLFLEFDEKLENE